ncbi:asparagine synthase-related protein [Chryseobacterium sp.]|uniref:asparagine synthase-related protein n=1 Tax=Chryseobacterium sp. TaxID=1871047 RepID=UPI00162AABFC|nr:asparagine synthase-related protein [Chryseobacterium sp.]
MNSGFSLKIKDKKVKTLFSAENYDSFLVENDGVEMAVEGVILNKKKLLEEYYFNDFSLLFLKFYTEKKEKCINELEGEFRGYIWDKVRKRIFVFTNPTATQRVFYAKTNNVIFIDSNLVRLSTSLKTTGINPTPDIQNIYQLLSFGSMLENATPIRDVFKVLDGHYIEIDLENHSIKEKGYFSLENISYWALSKEKAIQEIHELFAENIKAEYRKDDEYRSKHFALISGGLDSRTAMLYAVKMNKKPDTAFCFSQSSYLDEKISRKIAKDFQIKYEFQPLDGGSYLKEIDKLTEISEGCGLYTGGIHVNYAFERLAETDFKIVHGGAIGDGILGGFNLVPYRRKPEGEKLIINRSFLSKVGTSFDDAKNLYESEELFYLRNVACNKTVLGAQVIQQYAYQTSPFMTKEMLKMAISIPEKWKFKQRFYLDWIAKHCPEATKYRWERTLMKPDAKWKTAFGDQVVKRGFKIVHDKILKTPQKSSMYPYQYYFDQDNEIQKYYQKYFEENLHRVQAYPELSADLLVLFDSPDFYSKSQAVNILSVFKLYF